MTEEIKLLFKKATDCFNKGQFEEAITFYNTIVEKDHFNTDAYLNKAVACIYLQRLDEAEKLCLYAIDLKPTSLGYSTLAGIYCQEEKFHEAIKASKQAVDFDVHNEHAYINCAVAQLGLDNFVAAIKLCNKLLTFAPDNHDAIKTRDSAIILRQEYNPKYGKSTFRDDTSPAFRDDTSPALSDDSSSTSYFNTLSPLLGDNGSEVSE